MFAIASDAEGLKALMRAAFQKVMEAALREGTYRPLAVRRGTSRRADGRTRPLGIPTVENRIVQQAVRLVIEPIFESGFADASYSLCPDRGCHDVLREVDRLLEEGFTPVVDAGAGRAARR
jgi:RNA-directed DNA polymerase